VFEEALAVVRREHDPRVREISAFLHGAKESTERTVGGRDLSVVESDGVLTRPR
jgi:hypothetical protein